jgi:hypothetical protein
MWAENQALKLVAIVELQNQRSRPNSSELRRTGLLGSAAGSRPVPLRGEFCASVGKSRCEEPIGVGIAIQRKCSGSDHFLNAFWGRLRPDCEYDSSVDLPRLEALENIVD